MKINVYQFIIIGCWVNQVIIISCWVNWVIIIGCWVNWVVIIGCWVNWVVIIGCWVNCRYGQMTAGSYCYIGPQGIVHGTMVRSQKS